MQFLGGGGKGESIIMFLFCGMFFCLVMKVSKRVLALIARITALCI